MDKYSQALLNSASRLDATVGACGEITKLATAVVEEKSKVATIAFLQKISEMIDGDQKEIKLVAQTVNSTLLQFYGYSTIKDICKPAAEEPEDKKSLQELLEELNQRGEMVTFLGDGVPVFRELIAEKLQVPYSFAPAHVNKQRAAAVAALGSIYYKEGRTETAMEHIPEYLRVSQAERERAEREAAKADGNA